MNLPKFKIGNRVLITRDSYRPLPMTTPLIGQVRKITKVCEARKIVEDNYCYCLENSMLFFLERDLALEDKNIKCRK